jgi:ParB family chromosome partitioning protein
MARAPLEVVGQIIAAPIASIVIGERLRPLDPVWAAALGEIMAVEGQKDLIKICQLPGRNDFRLVTGLHRLEGGRLQGWKTIKAEIVDHAALERRLTEVSENLWRSILGPVDKAAFIAELNEVLRAKAGVDPAATSQQIAAGARWQDTLKADAAEGGGPKSHAKR